MAAQLTLTNPIPTTPISGSSPAEARAQHNFASLAHAYRAIPMTAKGTWQLALKLIPLNPNGLRGLPLTLAPAILRVA